MRTWSRRLLYLVGWLILAASAIGTMVTGCTVAVMTIMANDDPQGASFDGPLPDRAVELSSGFVKHRVLPTGVYWLFGVEDDLDDFFDRATGHYADEAWGVAYRVNPYPTLSAVSPDGEMCVLLVDLSGDEPGIEYTWLELDDPELRERANEYRAQLYVLKRPCGDEVGAVKRPPFPSFVTIW